MHIKMNLMNGEIHHSRSIPDSVTSDIWKQLVLQCLCSILIFDTTAKYLSTTWHKIVQKSKSHNAIIETPGFRPKIYTENLHLNIQFEQKCKNRVQCE